MSLIKATAPYDPDAQLAVIRKRRCELSLYEYVKQAWHVVEPANPFVDNWHIEFLCLHLSAITDGVVLDNGDYYRKLLINIPPGSMKSLITAVFWPTWEWGPKNMPHLRHLTASFSADRAAIDSNRARDLIKSSWYQGYWGDCFTLVKDGEEYFSNDKKGWRRSRPFSKLTGDRGDRLIIDDPHSTEMAESNAERKRTIRIFTESAQTRLNNQNRSAIVVIMQRLHEEDVSGVILDRKMDFDHIMLPMRYDPGRAYPTMLGYVDPREADGELLFEARFSERVLAQLEKDMGTYATAGQMQQMPEPRGGGIVKDIWWQLWDQPHYPAVEFVVAALDTAYTTKAENDPSAMTVFGVWAGNNTESQTTRSVDRYGRTMDATVSYSSGDITAMPKAMLMYAWQAKLELHDLALRVADTCRKMKVDLLLIENKAAGHSVAQELRRLFQNENFGVQMYDPGGLDKVVRLYAVQHIFQEKMVYAPDKDWAEMVIRQVSIFPKGAHDDLVDCVSMCLQHIRNVGMLTRAPEVLAGIEADKNHHGAEPPPLYGA